MKLSQWKRGQKDNLNILRYFKIWVEIFGQKMFLNCNFRAIYSKTIIVMRYERDTWEERLEDVTQQTVTLGHLHLQIARARYMCTLFFTESNKQPSQDRVALQETESAFERTPLGLAPPLDPSSSRAGSLPEKLSFSTRLSLDSSLTC